jgi:hypothetical protein
VEWVRCLRTCIVLIPCTNLIASILAHASFLIFELLASKTIINKSGISTDGKESDEEEEVGKNTPPSTHKRTPAKKTTTSKTDQALHIAHITTSIYLSFLIALWFLMLIITCIFFHSLSEKLIAWGLVLLFWISAHLIKDKLRVR